MANRTITPTVQLALGSSLFGQAFAETHFKLWDMVPINGDLSIRQRRSAGDLPSPSTPPPAGWSSGDTLTIHGSPTLRQGGILPEGGMSVTLNGTNQYLSSVYDETFAPGDVGPHSLEVVVVIHALPSAGQEPAVLGGTTEFAVTARDDGRLYGYYNGSAVVDLPFTIDQTLHIVLTRTNASPDVVTLYVNGVSDQATPANGAINRGYVHLGKHWSNAHYLNATYAFAAYYPLTLLADTVESHFNATMWTDVSFDVVVDPPLILERGIRDDSPTSRVGTTGICTFALDNSEINSAETLGYYSPEHASVRTGFRRGIPVRVLVDDEDDEYEIFRGRLQTIAPVAGVDGIRNTLCVATDLLDDLARFRLTQLPVMEDVTGDEVFLALIDTLPNQPNGITFDEGSDTYQIALDNTRDEKVTIMSELQRLAISEWGRAYVSRSGALVYENRKTRNANSVSLTLDDTQIAQNGLEVVERTRDAINRVEVTVHPRAVDDLPTTVLFSVESPIEIDSTETVVITGPYRVASAPDTIVRVGGLDLQQPEIVTDYLMNELEDGSGSDLSTLLTVRASYGANTVQYSLTNNSGGTAYVTHLQARGRGVYDFRTVVLESVDGSAIRAHGVNAIAIDMKYQADTRTGQLIADGVLDAYGGIATRARKVTLYANDDDLGGILGLDISDRIEITETLTNLDTEAFINGVRFEFQSGVLGMVTWWLAPPEDAEPFTAPGVVEDEIAYYPMLALTSKRS